MKKVKLLLELPGEIRAAMHMVSNIERYRKLSALTLVLSGTKSPNYLISTARELESILPNKQSKLLEGLDHNAPDETAPDKIAQILKEFFA